MTLAIQTIELAKRYTVSQGYGDLWPFRPRRQVEVLRGVNLEVRQGEIFGILGHNGAGKTTLLKILGTLVLPTAGQALVMGLDAAEEPRLVKEVLTYAVSEERSLYWRLTGRQNLEFFAALNNIPRGEAKGQISELLHLLDLDGAADRRVMLYSTGMRQKLVLARALLTDPEVLLLDEPARSIDPLMASSLWDFVRGELVDRRGKTVVMATHNLEEVRKVCDRVAVLHRGQVRACGTVQELGALVARQQRYTLTLHPSANGVHQVLLDTPGVLQVEEGPGDEGGTVSYEIVLDNPEMRVSPMLERVVAARGKVLACMPHEQSLREVLTALTEEES